MSESKFGYLLKQEYESDARWEEVDHLMRSGLTAQALRVMHQINLSWGCGAPQKIQGVEK